MTSISGDGLPLHERDPRPPPLRMPGLQLGRNRIRAVLVRGGKQ